MQLKRFKAEFHISDLNNSKIVNYYPLSSNDETKFSYSGTIHYKVSEPFSDEQTAVWINKRFLSQNMKISVATNLCQILQL
jgi:hypothetical protein